MSFFTMRLSKIKDKTLRAHCVDKGNWSFHTLVVRMQIDTTFVR